MAEKPIRYFHPQQYSVEWILIDIKFHSSEYIITYLYFKDKIVASESEGDYPQSIQNADKPFSVGICVHWIVRDAHGPSFG